MASRLRPGASTWPRTVADALRRPDADKWGAAISAELKAMEDFGVFSEVELPAGARALGSRVVLEVKRDGRYKARLVAQGFSQVSGVDFGETYSPVVSFPTVRAFLAVCTLHDLQIRQLDVKNAFLNAPLEDGEEIYIKLPEGYPERPPGTVLRLHRALYGLHQASRRWYNTFRSRLKTRGFEPCAADPGLFLRANDAGRVLAAVYVDDGLVAGDSSEAIDEVMAMLAEFWDVRDLGTPDDFLGISITRDFAAGTLKLDQSAYATRLVELFADQLVPASLPMPARAVLSKAQPGDDLAAGGDYRSLVGGLMYLANGTRPDISHSVGQLARHNQNPTQAHWSAALQVLRYVAGTLSRGLCYRRDGNAELIGYVDSNWAACLDTRRSVTGVIFLLAGAAIMWGSRTQPTVAGSTCQAEYMAYNEATRDALFLRKVLPDLGHAIEGPVSLKGDNDAALALLRNEQLTQRSRHYDVIHHFARERVQSGEVEFTWVPSKENVADCLTKALPKPELERAVHNLGLIE
jgi:Reverse transcriptase (RNA-dependent DNA polymerase)